MRCEYIRGRVQWCNKPTAKYPHQHSIGRGKKFLFRCYTIFLLWMLMIPFVVNEQSFLVIIRKKKERTRDTRTHREIKRQCVCVNMIQFETKRRRWRRNSATSQWNPSLFLRLTNEIFMNLIFFCFFIYYHRRFVSLSSFWPLFSLSSSFYYPISQFLCLFLSSLLRSLTCNDYKSYQFKTAGVCDLKTMKQHKNIEFKCCAAQEKETK